MKYVPKSTAHGAGAIPEYVAPAVDDTAPDVIKLLDQSKTILQREIRNLMAESSTKKLSPTSARDLTAYLRLLADLVKEEAEILASMSDEQLTSAGAASQAPKPKD